MRFKEFTIENEFSIITEISDAWYLSPDNDLFLNVFLDHVNIILQKLAEHFTIRLSLVFDLLHPNSTCLFYFKMVRLQKDPKILNLYHLIDDYYISNDSYQYKNDEYGEFIPFIRTVFFELLELFVPIRNYLIIDTSPANTNKDLSTPHMLYYLHYLHFIQDKSDPHQYLLTIDIYDQYKSRYSEFLSTSDNSSKEHKKQKKYVKKSNTSSQSLEEFLSTQNQRSPKDSSNKFLSKEQTSVPATEPQKTTSSLLDDPHLSRFAKLKQVLNHHVPALTSHPKNQINSLISKLSYDQIPDDQKDNYLKLFPQYIQKEFSNIMESNLSDEEKHTALNKIISEYQTVTSHRLKKQQDNITHYLTTQGKSNQNIPDNTKGLVYTITLPEKIPEEIKIVRGQPLEVPKIFLTLIPSLKGNEMNILRSRLFNLKRVIHNDSLMLANAIFLGKTLLVNTVVSSQSLLTVCLKIFSCPDEWQQIGRKFLTEYLGTANTTSFEGLFRDAVNIKKPKKKKQTPTSANIDNNDNVDEIEDDSTIDSFSEMPDIDLKIRFPVDLKTTLYCTKGMPGRLKRIIVCSVADTISGLIPFRLLGSLMLLWLYDPLCDTQVQTNTDLINTRAMSLFFPSLQYACVSFLKNLAKHGEAIIFPVSDTESRTYTISFNKHLLPKSPSYAYLNNIWQGTRLLILRIALLTNASLQKQLDYHPVSVDLYLQLYHSAFDVLKTPVSSLFVTGEQVWASFLQFFILLIAERKQFIKPSILQDCIRALKKNYKTLKNARQLPTFQVLPRNDNLNIVTTTDETADDQLDLIELSEDSTDTTTSQEWTPQLQNIIEYNTNRIRLDFGKNEVYNNTNAYMRVVFIDNVGDWRFYTHKGFNSVHKPISIKRPIFLNEVEDYLTNLSSSELAKVKSAFQNGQSLSFKQKSSKKIKEPSDIILVPDDCLGAFMQLPRTPAPQSKDDWIHSFFQLSGVNPLLVLLSEQSSKSNVYHRTYRLPHLLWKKLSSDSLPTFHFGLANSKYENNKSPPLHSSTDTATAVMSTKSKTYKYLFSIDRGVKNDLTFMICDYPQTQLPTNNLYSDSNINKRKWLGFYLNIRGTGIIGHTTPRIKGSSDENINNDKSMYEPALLIAKNGIISYITKDTIKVLSLSKTTDSSPSIVQYDFAIPTTTNHGKVKYHCNQTNSYNLNLSIPKLTGYKLKKVYSIQDKPQTKQEAWLYHILRIKAKLNSRYIYVTNRIQLLALLDDLYAFIIPSTSVPSEFNILSTKTKTSVLLSKIKEYLDKHKKDPFLKQFSPKLLAHLLKSNLRHHLKNIINDLWNTLVNARVEFSKLLIMLLSDEVFGSGLLPPDTQPEEVLLVMEDLKNYKSRKTHNSTDYHVNPLWTDLEDAFVQQHRIIGKAKDSLITSKRKMNKNKTNKKNTSSDPKYKVDKKFLSKQLHRAKYRLIWLNKARELDTFEVSSRRNTLWSHGQLKGFLEQEFNPKNLIEISPAYTSQRCMWCDKIGNRQGETFTCNKNSQCLFYAIPVHADVNASGVIANDYLNYYRKKHESKFGKS